MSHVCSSPRQILTRLVTVVMGSLNHSKSVNRLSQLSPKEAFCFCGNVFQTQKVTSFFMITASQLNQTVTTVDKLLMRFHNSCSLLFNYSSTVHTKGPGHTHMQQTTHRGSIPNEHAVIEWDVLQAFPLDPQSLSICSLGQKFMSVLQLHV